MINEKTSSVDQESFLKYCLSMVNIPLKKDLFIDPKDFTKEKFFKLFMLLLQKDYLNKLYREL